jgi:type II secretory ATPase GspE/PulE/Tfp pilus assembly ATPase PilB-like protein
MTHWLERVAREHGLLDAKGLSIPESSSIEEAWAATERACGIDGPELAALVAKTFRAELADLTTAEPTAARLLPVSVVRRFCVFPLRDGDRALDVAASDPVHPDMEKEVSFASGRSVVLSIAHPADIASAIEATYSPEMATEALLARVEGDVAGLVEVGLAVEEEPENVTEEEIVSGPVVRLTNLVLAEAVTRGASDIHIQPHAGGGVVRFRTDGVLRTGLRMPLPVMMRVVSRIKIIGGLDIADRLRPQDGRARIHIARRPYDLRISTVPHAPAECGCSLRPPAGQTRPSS